MVPKPSTPKRQPTGRRRGRPPGTTNAVRAARAAALAAEAASEPPAKRRRYIPGGPGGGGRFIDPESLGTPVPPGTSSRRAAVAGLTNTATPSTFPRRERSARSRVLDTPDGTQEMRLTSAAAAAAAVQSEGYKPREERGWEEFHPHLDIEATFMVFSAADVDGIAKSTPGTPPANYPATPVESSSTPVKDPQPHSTGTTPTVQPSSSHIPLPMDIQSGTTPKRRVGRPPRDSVSFYASQTPRTPRVLPIFNQTPKERLDLKQPAFRRTDRVLVFENSNIGQGRYVDKSMMNVGYQESDEFIRPPHKLVKAFDSTIDEEIDQAAADKSDPEIPQPVGGILGRVEYDMDEQDDKWLEAYNAERKSNGVESIAREIFEITVTKIEKEWHALEKRIPKPNPKPPQTHRPRSSSAVAVNGEPLGGEEQDSKCAICDDGDCENTNAIVFCDGCDLAVHQECYGVPFIPEGQWLCRKCQLIGRGVPTCIFCPNTDGAFKQTNSSKWAHLLCAMWIPEVSLGNHTFMEPVMDVDKVPKTRWKLSCYICNQKMGACIQCSNKSCYQAFHVTCARRARLFLKMKNSQGALSILDGNTVLKAYCDKHCPPDYTKDNAVALATRQAMKFYKKRMKDWKWVDNLAMANALAATYRHANSDHAADEAQLAGSKLAAGQAGSKRNQQTPKSVWKLPSGAPIIPQAVFDIVESSLSRFTLRKRREFVADACRYWTLKRESRRGAALLKRLQLQMEAFSSMELTRRNFALMGPVGKARLLRRIEFAENLVEDLDQLKRLANGLVEREQTKREAAELERDFVDTCYFPVAKLLVPVIERALALDKDIFEDGFTELQARLENRFYSTTLAFAQDFCEVISDGINQYTPGPGPEPIDGSPTKQGHSEARDRKRVGKRIVKAITPQLETALRLEVSITHKPLEGALKELETLLETCVELRQSSIAVSQDGDGLALCEDIIMVDAQPPAANEVHTTANGVPQPNGSSGAGLDYDGQENMESNIEVNTSSLRALGGTAFKAAPSLSPAPPNGAGMVDPLEGTRLVNGVEDKNTPPATNGYVGAPQQPAQTTPPTPPQSNGCLGGGATVDPLVEGGVPWHLKTFDPRGTEAVVPEWAGRDAVRSLSEELTDIDDDELTGLGLDVDADTITASPIAAEVTGDTIVSAATKAAKTKAVVVKKRTRSSARRR